MIIFFISFHEEIRKVGKQFIITLKALSRQHFKIDFVFFQRKSHQENTPI